MVLECAQLIIIVSYWPLLCSICIDKKYTQKHKSDGQLPTWMYHLVLLLMVMHLLTGHNTNMHYIIFKIQPKHHTRKKQTWFIYFIIEDWQTFYLILLKVSNIVIDLAGFTLQRSITIINKFTFSIAFVETIN